MSCLLFWCCGGLQSDSDTENKANEGEVKKDGGKTKRKKKWRIRKTKGQQKITKTKDVERAEESQAGQQPAAGEKESDAPHVPAGLGSGSLENIPSVILEKMGTPLQDDLQTEAEVEHEAIKPLMCTDLDEKDADNNQPLENERLEKASAEAEAEAIQELMNIYRNESEETVEKHLAGDQTTEATLTEAEVEAVKDLMLLFIDKIEADLLGCEVMNVTDTEPEAPTFTMQTYLDNVDTPNEHPLVEEEMFEVMDTDDNLDTETESLAGDEMTEATLTEAEVEAVKNLMLLFIDQIEAESLGCEVMSAADTEVEASTHNMQNHLDETDPSNDEPLGNETRKDADVEEADDINKPPDTQLDDTKTTFNQALGKDVEMTLDPEPIKSWAEGNINQNAKIEASKKDTPENETKKEKQKKKTRRGTRGKGRKINYKKDQ
ncbi:hypothetical protein MHYP_G00306390 [Metynnis hypsauchen]